MHQTQLFIVSRKLGFDGYSDFKSYLKFESQSLHEVPTDSIKQFKQEIETTFTYLERVNFNLITEKIDKATNVYLYGTGRAQKM